MWPASIVALPGRPSRPATNSIPQMICPRRLIDSAHQSHPYLFITHEPLGQLLREKAARDLARTASNATCNARKAFANDAPP
jgi:hypothetical protein